MNLKAAFLAAATAVTVPAASYTSYCAILIWSGNFHTVDEGRLYRSAQLSQDEFAQEIDAHHIRTVLNLRGPNPGQKWYQNEIAATREHGAEHYDIGISAYAPVPSSKINEIWRCCVTRPSPILVHCKSGSDRTGFVSALYRYVIQGQEAEKAEQ